METTDTPHDAWMTKARKVYFSANSAGVWPQSAVIAVLLASLGEAPQEEDKGHIQYILSCQTRFHWLATAANVSA